MARSFNRFILPLAIGSIATAAAIGCGGDDDTSSSSGGSGGTGGSTAGTGGTGGAGATTSGGSGGSGAATTGGAGGATTGGSGGATTGGSGGSTGGTGGTATDGGADPYTCIANQTEPGGTAAAGADCCEGLGTCAAPGDLTGDSFASNYGVDTCDNSASLVCAPKPDDQLPDGGATPTCSIDLGGTVYEGRCIPACFVLGTPGASNLNAGDCPTNIVSADVVCAPCYSPLDGQATGACTRQQGDAPADPAPTPFPECGAYAPPDAAAGTPTGLCVPETLITESGVGQATIDLLPQDSCGTGELCVPKKKVEDIGQCFEACESGVGPGACVPSYIVAGFPGAGDFIGSILTQGTCEDGETCAPCANPLQGGAPTGACDN